MRDKYRLNPTNASVQPKAAPVHFPFRNHRTMAEVMHDEFRRAQGLQKNLTKAEYFGEAVR